MFKGPTHTGGTGGAATNLTGVMFYLTGTAVPSGSQTVVVNWSGTGTEKSAAVAVTYKNVGSIGVQNVFSGGNGAGAAMSITLTTTVSNAAMIGVVGLNDGTKTTVSSGITGQINDATKSTGLAAGTTVSLDHLLVPAAGNKTTSWTWTGNARMAGWALELKP